MIRINDELVIKGVQLLKRFVESVKIGGSKRALEELVGLIESGYLPFMSIDALSDNNIIDSWNRYKGDFASWLENFIGKYGIDAPIDDLSIDYKARVSFLTIMLLVRDLIEVRYLELNSDIQQLLNSPVINWSDVSLSLNDLIRFVYPMMLWAAMGAAITEGTEVIRIASIFSKEVKALYEVTKSKGKSGGGVYKVYKLLYMPLVITGLMSEDVVYRLVVGEARKYRFNVTGLGQSYVKVLAPAFLYSLDTEYYRMAIAVFAAISHVHDFVLKSLINQVLSTDVYGIINSIIREYEKYRKYGGSYSNVYTASYVHDNVLRDLSAMTFTLINMRDELSNELNKPSSKFNPQSVNLAFNTLISKYSFLISGSTEELVNEAIKTTWLASRRIT